MLALARAGDATTAEQPTVHVIDDDVSLRDALGQLLPYVGLDVCTYGSVQEFLDAGAHWARARCLRGADTEHHRGRQNRDRREKRHATDRPPKAHDHTQALLLSRGYFL